MASETVNILGKPVKKNTALIVGVAGAGVAGFAIYRKHQASTAAASTGTGTAAQFTDPAGNACAAADPATGYCPGTPEDISAQQQLSATGATGLDNLGGTLGYGYGGGGTVVSGGVSGTGSSIPSFTDNGSWGQYVEAQLGSNGGDAIAAAIAKYLSGQSVTSAQQTTIEEAIAIANYPPVSGQGGFPPSIRLSAAGPSPSPAPSPAPGGGVAGAVTGLKVTAVWSTGADLHWDAAPGATSYAVALAGQPAANIGNTTYHGIGGLKPKTRYTAWVTAEPASSGHASVSFTTK